MKNRHHRTEFEIGRVLHLKSEIRNCKMDCLKQAADESDLRFRISDFRCRIRPISNFLALIPLLLMMMLASAAGAQVGQIKTAEPGEPVERHLSSDQTFKEWGLDPNVADDIKRIKVCRVEEVCKMRFKEGETPRMRVRNLVLPLRYDDENMTIPETFTRQVQQALDNL